MVFSQNKEKKKTYIIKIHNFSFALQLVILE